MKQTPPISWWRTFRISRPSPDRARGIDKFDDKLRHYSDWIVFGSLYGSRKLRQDHGLKCTQL
jgi:hypothetical protein